MARKPQVNYWPSRKGGGYFCVFQGVQQELQLGPDDAPTGPTYLAALEAFKRLLADSTRGPGERVTVRRLLDEYLKHLDKTRKPATVRLRLQACRPFVDHRPDGAQELLGERVAAELVQVDVYAFLEAMERPRHQRRKREQAGRKLVKWGRGSQRNAIVSLQAAFNWGVRVGLLNRNPLQGIEQPTANSRGAETMIGSTTEECELTHARILAAVPSPFREFVQALKDTGARPGELIAATAADFDREAGAFIFRKEASRGAGRFSHKTAGKGRDRVIFLHGATLAHVLSLIDKRPSGPLFRQRNGRPFTEGHLATRFMRLRQKLNLPHLTAYSYRHTFATALLKAGMDVDALAEVMGNSAQVIRRHYSHLLADTKGLRAKLERFTAAAQGTQIPPAGTGPKLHVVG